MLNGLFPEVFIHVCLFIIIPTNVLSADVRLLWISSGLI